MRPPAARPKRERRQPPMSQTEVQAEFADALHRAGLRPKGAPIMDGKKHRVPVEGDRQGPAVRDLYRASRRLTRPATSTISRPARKSAGGRRGPAGEMAPEERGRASGRRVAAEQSGAGCASAGTERRWWRIAVSAVWNRARPVQTHPYLTRKGIEAHGLRQDRRGDLLVPDARHRRAALGRADHHAGRRQAVHARRPQAGHARAAGRAAAGRAGGDRRGFRDRGDAARGHRPGHCRSPSTAATCWTWRARFRERDPQRPIIIAADNDHHLPRREPPLPNVGLEKATRGGRGGRRHRAGAAASRRPTRGRTGTITRRSTARRRCVPRCRRHYARMVSSSRHRLRRRGRQRRLIAMQRDSARPPSRAKSRVPLIGK